LNEATDNDVGIIQKLPTLRLTDPADKSAEPAVFVFSPARKDPSVIYVKTGETYLGKIADGLFRRSRECTDEQSAQIAAAAADPAEAAKAFGLRYAICGCCGLTLTNKISRERGIGPICYAKWF